jgi:hypothetical protein
MPLRMRKHNFQNTPLPFVTDQEVRLAILTGREPELRLAIRENKDLRIFECPRNPDFRL